MLSLPAVAGLAVRFRAAARARELDQVRLGERELLARELHDTVAHHVSAMVVRAQAGRVVAATRPEAALEALAVIEAEGARRSPRCGRSSARCGRARSRTSRRARRRGPRAARPARRAGRAVDVRTDGDLSTCTPRSAPAVYRIAQESVTNADAACPARHRVEVTVAREDDRGAPDRARRRRHP